MLFFCHAVVRNSSSVASLQGSDENGLGLAPLAGCGPRRGRGGRHERLEAPSGLHEEEALGEDRGLQGVGAELEDEGPGKCPARCLSLCAQSC